MKKLLLIIILCRVAERCPAQYFNERNTLHSFAAMLTNLAEHNHFYYTIGLSIDSSNIDLQTQLVQPNVGIRFTKWGKNGQLVKDTFYQKNKRNIETWDKTLHFVSDSSLVVASLYYDSTGTHEIQVTCLDTNGLVLWENTFVKPICTDRYFFRVKDLKRLATGEWLSIATLSCTYGNLTQADYLLTKYDSLFNIIWHKQLGNPNLNDIADRILIDADGNYILGGTSSNAMYIGFPERYAQYRTQLIKTDTAGNILWQWMSDSTKFQFYVHDLIRTQDGGYVYCGNGDGYKKEVNPVSHDTSIVMRGWIEKIDANRNPVWSYGIGGYERPSDRASLHRLKELNDGSIVAAGAILWGLDGTDTTGPDVKSFGVLYKFGANGLQQWRRGYQYAPNTYSHIFYDMASTKDGGYLMVGQASRHLVLPNEPRQQAWLVKVDSNGCLGPQDPQCLPQAITNTHHKQAAVKLYPNPTTGTLTLSWEGMGIENRFMLTDILGRAVHDYTFQGSSGYTQLSIAQLPPGIYLYKTWGKNGEVVSGKILKE